MKNEFRIFLAKKKGAVFEGANKIGPKSCVYHSSIGYGTYFGKDVLLNNCKIGRYCSIASGVKVIQGMHPTSEWVSTHPSFFSTSKQSGIAFTDDSKYAEEKYADDHYSIVIGNDVWIGQDAKILAGVTVGDGAIIGAEAFVNKNVPPYAVVGGVPAKILKYRFDDEQIGFLLKYQWWYKDHLWIRKHAHLFENIEKFMKSINDENL